MKLIKQLTIIIGFLLLSSRVLPSNDVLNTQTQNTQSKNTETNTSQVSHEKNWDLTETEWQHYLILMQGPSGHYYQKLSPTEVLGMNSTSPDEMRHFAEISAKFEHDKLERELKFNRAFHEATARLYSTEPIIKPFDLTPFTPIPKSQN